MAGNNVRRNFEGMTRGCSQCASEIVVTAQMVKRSKYTCGPCESARSVEWARRNREKKRASNNAHHKRMPIEKRSEMSRRYAQRHPEKRSAHHAVQTAVRNGTLVRLPCERCGSARTHAHHDDYGKPLDVIWLCHSHHMLRHQELANAERSAA